MKAGEQLIELRALRDVEPHWTQTANEHSPVAING